MLVFNKLVPELSVSDFERSLKFYCQVVGFKIEYERPEDSFAYVSFCGSQIMLEQQEDEVTAWSVGQLVKPYGRGVNFSIECLDAHALARKIEQAGYSLRKPVEDCEYRHDACVHVQRSFLVQDPDGYLLRFAQRLSTKPVRDEL